MYAFVFAMYWVINIRFMRFQINVHRFFTMIQIQDIRAARYSHFEWNLLKLITFILFAKKYCNLKRNVDVSKNTLYWLDKNWASTQISKKHVNQVAVRKTLISTESSLTSKELMRFHRTREWSKFRIFFQKPDWKLVSPNDCRFSSSRLIWDVLNFSIYCFPHENFMSARFSDY